VRLDPGELLRDKCRDGAKAVELATPGLLTDDWKDPDFLDTLGVAYAEVGNFEQAIRSKKSAQFPQWAETGDGARAPRSL